MPVIQVDHLHKRYGAQVAVEDVSLAVEEGEIFGILGPNGAGKTTTVECVAGLRHPDGGAIRVLGLDPQHDRNALRDVLGVQLQQSELPEKLRVGEALDLYSSFYRDPADWRELLDTLGLGGKRDTAYRKLSGGQKQRLSIALALVGNPRIAILDELTTGLDPAARRDTWDLIERVRSRGVTILLVSHFMDEAEHLCDRVALIDSGRVAAIDTPAGLISRVQAGQRIRFRPSGPLDESLLAELPGVTAITRAGDQLLVTAERDVLGPVVMVLTRLGLVAENLRVEQASLDDAFLALTGRSIEPAPPAEPVPGPQPVSGGADR